jgi:hypothetical protein
LYDVVEVKSHFFFENYVLQAAEVIKNVDLINETSGVKLDFFKDPNNPEHVIYLLHLKFFLSIPDLINLISY